MEQNGATLEQQKQDDRPSRHHSVPGYEQAYETSRQVSYQQVDGAMNPTEASGTLPQGKIVWGAKDLLAGDPPENTVVMLEGNGPVRLATGALRIPIDSLA